MPAATSPGKHSRGGKRAARPVRGARRRESRRPGPQTTRLHEIRQVRDLRTTDDRAARVRFRRAITLMVMTLFVPGSAQMLAGNRKVGRIALRIWLVVGLVLAFCVLLGLLWDGFVFSFAANTTMLGVLRLAMMVLAVGWVVLLVDAWRIGQPLTLLQNHRLAVVGLNGLLCLAVAGPLLFGAHVLGVQKEFVSTVFGKGEATEAVEGRFNVLLLGGDSGAGRWGLRPDSITVASIDAATGKTILFGLPRNMADFPFAEGSVMAKQFPDGFDCEGCMLNGVATWAGDNPDLFKNPDTAGTEATISAVEGITGLDINYWVMVNLQGFRDLVDAVGGVTLNVRDRIPVGLPTDDFFTYIEPGVKKLNGYHTLWFARAREGSDDYSRMARQKCVMSAMLDQIDPQTMLRNFDKIARATSGMVQTDMPASELGTFADLAMKAKDQKITSVSFVPPLINTGDPDIELIHRRVAETIDPPDGKTDPAKKKKKRKKPATVIGGSLGSTSSGYLDNDTDDVAAAC